MVGVLRHSLSTLLCMVLAACTANSGPGVASNSSTTTTKTVTATAQEAAPAVTLAISPHAVAENQSATATWSTENATSCWSTGAWSGTDALENPTGTAITEAGPGTYTFSIACSGPGGAKHRDPDAAVGAVPAPTIQFHMSPRQVQPGNSAAITWATTNATSCTGSGGMNSDGWSGNQAVTNVDGFVDAADHDTGPVSVQPHLRRTRWVFSADRYSHGGHHRAPCATHCHLQRNANCRTDRPIDSVHLDHSERHLVHGIRRLRHKLERLTAVEQHGHTHWATLHPWRLFVLADLHRAGRRHPVRASMSQSVTRQRCLRRPLRSVPRRPRSPRAAPLP